MGLVVGWFGRHRRRLGLAADPDAAGRGQSLPAKLGSTPADIFVSGMMCLLLFQLAGYSLAWAGWWLKHR